MAKRKADLKHTETPSVHHLEAGYAKGYDYLWKWAQQRGSANSDHSQKKCFAGGSKQNKHFEPGAHKRRKVNINL